jgi:hypothetical protein
MPFLSAICTVPVGQALRWMMDFTPDFLAFREQLIAEIVFWPRALIA